MFFLQAEDGIRDIGVTGVQTCALPICCATKAQPGCRGPGTGGACDSGVMGLVHWKGHGLLISRAAVGATRRPCLSGWEGLVAWSREAAAPRRETGGLEEIGRAHV